MVKLSDASKIDILIAALKTLRTAVNDKQPDPGAVAFIDRVLRAVSDNVSEDSDG